MLGDELWRTLIPEGQSLAVHASVHPVYMSLPDAEESLQSAAIGMYIIRYDENRRIVISVAGAGAAVEVATRFAHSIDHVHHVAVNEHSSGYAIEDEASFDNLSDLVSWYTACPVPLPDGSDSVVLTYVTLPHASMLLRNRSPALASSA